MTLTLHILSTGAQAGRDSTITMTGEALTIGRADTNDLVLPDPNREISSSHCVLQAKGSEFIVVDTSTNGTFLNRETAPLGDFPSPLNNGDTLRIGPYEMRVNIALAAVDPLAGLPPPAGEEALMDPELAAAGADAIADIASLDTEGGDFLDGLLGEAPPNAMKTPTRDIAADGPEAINEFLDETPDPELQGGASTPNHSAAVSDFYQATPGAEGAIPDDWDDDLLSPGTPKASKPGAAIPETTDFGSEPGAPLDDSFNDPPAPEPPAKAPEPAAAPPPKPAPELAPVAAKPPAKSGSGADLARAFLISAGVNEAQIADDELKTIMEQSGTVFRTLIEGAREVLMARASIKDELRLGQTMISPDGNNPIKFSISGQQAVEAMVKPTVAGYKTGPAAAEEAMRDIKAHEVAMMSGMETAIKTLLKRFDPENLAQKLEDSGGISGLLKGKKARYWEVFEKLYSQISDEAEEDFQTLFGKEFAKAYTEQMLKLKTATGKET